MRIYCAVYSKFTIHIHIPFTKEMLIFSPQNNELVNLLRLEKKKKTKKHVLIIQMFYYQ